MQKWKLVVGVLLVFSAGALVGSFGTGWGMRYFFQRYKSDSQYRVDFVLDRLSHRLDLSTEQKNKIHVILTQSDQKLEQYWITVQSEIDQIINLLIVEINKELDSNQIEQLKEISTELESQRKGHLKSFSTPAPVEKAP